MRKEKAQPLQLKYLMSAIETIKLLIVDDHTIVRKGLVELVESDEMIKVTAEAGSAAQALRCMLEQDFDVVVMDISMPGRSGLEALKDIRENYPGVPVLILSMYPEEQYAFRVMKSGAAGYMTKESAPEELIMAIKMVCQGKKYISENIAQQLADRLDETTNVPAHELLSDREYEVMLSIAEGKSISKIAEDLSLSVKTVSTYRSRLLKKLDLKNNSELLHYTIKNKIID